MQGFFYNQFSFHGSLTAPLINANKSILTSNVLASNIDAIEDLWLKPSEVAKITGLSEKWLEAARQGKKGYEGPPFKKIGNGKTSPIRYSARGLKNWMDSFESKTNIHNSFSHPSFVEFNQHALPSDIWPFVLYKDGTMDELFHSINSGRFLSEYRNREIFWLAKLTIENLNFNLKK